MNHILSVLSIASSGAVTCLWTDKLPLALLGRLDIKRASTIEFDGETQLWEVRLNGSIVPGAAPVFRSPSRAECIAWEIKTFNAELAL